MILFINFIDKQENIIPINETDRHTERQTEWLGEKHNTFFQRCDDSFVIHAIQRMGILRIACIALVLSDLVH